MTSTAPMPSTRPLAASYDQGSDIQPSVSWANPNKDSYPKTSLAASAPSPSSALERNLNPLDKEDPRLQTKALPFAGVDSAELAAAVQSPAYEAHDELALHNGNILDRTMDHIRTWVHSFQQRAGGADYEEYVEEVDDAHPTKGSGAVDAAKARLSSLAQQTSDTLQQVGNAAQDKASAVSSSVRQQAGELQHRVGDAVAVVSDKASVTVQQVKGAVNDLIAQHQSQPGEPLTQTLQHSIAQQLPSQGQVQDTVSAILPPLAQQASSSYAFLASFVKQYLSTYRDYFLALRRQSLPLQAMTGLLFVTHAVLPLFFLEKGPARSVLYCYLLSAVLSHLTFFTSGHLRYQFLAHVAFIPMLVSLTLHAGFGEASQANQVGAEYQDGHTLKAMLIAPLSLRSYFFVLWLRVVLMVQASLLTLDAVNVLDMLGFSLETRRGQEMALINRSVAQMRRNFAHSVAPPPTTTHAERQTVRSTTTTTSTSSAQPSQAAQSKRAAEDRSGQVLVQSHEKASSEGLRERKPHAVHPTYYVNNERV